MQCPHCGLENPDHALRCDCGFDFTTQTIEQSYTEVSKQCTTNNSPRITQQDPRAVSRSFDAGVLALLLFTLTIIGAGHGLAPVAMFIIAGMLAIFSGATDFGSPGEEQSMIMGFLFYVVALLLLGTELYLARRKQRVVNIWVAACSVLFLLVSLVGFLQLSEVPGFTFATSVPFCGTAIWLLMAAGKPHREV